MNPDSRKNHGKRRRTWMRFAGISVLITTVGVVASASQAGADPVTPKHFQPAPAGSTVEHLPLGVSNAPVTVMVQMAGDPVTVADADAATPLTGTQRSSRRAQLRQQQTSAAPTIRALGGQVLGTYQLAYNGIKVRIAANKVDSLRSIPNVVGVHRVQLMTPDNIHGVPLIGAPAVWDGAQRLPRRGHQDRRHRHRHRLHARRLRWRRAPRRPTPTRTRHETEPADPAFFGPNAPEGQGRHRPRRRQLQRRPDERGLPAGAAPGPEPAGLLRSRHPRRRHGGRLRRAGRRHARTPVRTTTRRSAATPGSSARAWRRRPTSTRSASSAARARPT